jgi:hypothetical protein
VRLGRSYQFWFQQWWAYQLCWLLTVVWWNRIYILCYWCCKTIESIMIEILINKRKWLISGLYRPQSINDNNFNKDFIDTFDKISTLYDNVLILGDIKLKTSWSKFLKLLYSTNFLFILGIVPLIWTDITLWTSLKPQLKFCIFWQNKQNWEIYRKQKNLVNKIKKQSIRNYFIERCAGGPKSKHFWPTQ